MENKVRKAIEVSHYLMLHRVYSYDILMNKLARIINVDPFIFYKTVEKLNLKLWKDKSEYSKEELLEYDKRLNLD